MLRFIVTAEHSYTFKALTTSSIAAAVRVVSYEQLFATHGFYQGVYVFTDIDRLSFQAQLAASERYLALASQPQHCKAFNNPARVKTRYALLRALHEAGVNSFNAYRVDELRRPERFPVFIRREQEHGTPLSDLLHDQAALDEAIRNAVASGVPERAILIIEYCGAPVREGLYRRLSAYRIGDRIVPAPAAHEANWCVKYGTKGIATEALYQEDLEIVRTNPYRGAIERAFEVANIAYGRVDFGVVDGRVEVYEINTNPDIKAPSDHPSATRRATMACAWEGLLEAFSALDDPALGERMIVETRRRAPPAANT